MSFLDKINACNRRDLSGFLPFTIGGTRYGWIAPQRLDSLGRFPGVFTLDAHSVALHARLATPEQRSAAVAAIADALVAAGFPAPTGELYAVKNNWSDPEAMRLDRAFIPAFGARAYGVHVNGIVETARGPSLWIATRASDRDVEPGKLDNVVAGGQPAGLSLIDNLVKECAEEAGFSSALARTARPVGHIAYAFVGAKGLRNDVLYCYDLTLPPEAVPRNIDGEIERFDLIPAEDVLAMARDGDRFKFNVPLVIIDFGLRCGLITSQTAGDYAEIVAGLRRSGLD